MIRKRGGIISYLYRQNKGRGKRAIGMIRTYYLQHGTVYTVTTEYCTVYKLTSHESHEKFCRDLNLQAAVLTTQLLRLLILKMLEQ